MSKDARVGIGIEGAEDVTSAARKVTDAWKSAGSAVAGAFSSAGREIASQLGSIAQDALRTVTVMRTLDMHGAIEGARAYREEVTRFGAAAGTSVGATRQAFETVSKMTLEGESTIAAWSKGVGRLTYDYAGAVISAKALHDESVATGKSFEEMGQLGVTLNQSLGVTDDMSKALGTIRAQADALGTIGGVSAFQDQIQALGGTFANMAVQSDEARNRVTALAGLLGRGYSPQQAQRVQSSVLGALSGNATTIEYETGVNILNEKGEVDPTKLGQALPKIQQFYNRHIPKRWRHQAYRQLFGNDLAASAFERGDFSEETIARFAEVSPSEHAGRVADRFADSAAGRARSNELQANRVMRQSLESVVELQDKYNAQFANNPMAGMAVSQLAQATLRWGAGRLQGLMGDAGESVAGGAAAEAGGMASAEVGLTGFTVGLGAATLALGTLAVGIAGTVKVLHDLGEASAKKQGFAVEKLTPEQAAEKAAAAKKAEEEARGHRSEGQQAALEAEQGRLRGRRALGLLSTYEDAYAHQTAPKLGGNLIAATEGPSADPVLAELAQELKRGQIDPSRLPKDIADALVNALASSPLKAVLQVAPAAPPKPTEGEN